MRTASAIRSTGPLGSLVFAGAVLAVAAIYFAAAELGLKMAFVAEQVTVVWPPTGIALATLLLFGCRFWPGVALGAFLANWTAHEPIGTALGIAAGNTLEAVAGAWVLQRWAGFANSLERLKDVLAFVLVAAAASTTLSATVGVASLCLGGVQPWSASSTLWWVWWLGDATGALLVAPMLLTWSAWPARRWPAWRGAEAAALLAVLAGDALIVFGGRLDTTTSHHPLEYTVFPFVIWAALRFGQPGTTVVTFVASGLAIWGTVNGLGPFAGGTPHENLILIQAFMGVVAVTSLLLSAAIAERSMAERRQAADFAVTQILAQSASLGDAIPRILDVICESFSWDLGCFWRVDRQAGVLRCLEVRHRPSARVVAFVAVTRQSVFELGVGLPGRIWRSGKPDWIADVTRDKNFPRAPVAADEGLHGGFCFPVRLGDEVLGVIEFFSHEIRQPDNDLLRMFATIGGQIGQFMERQRAEEALKEANRRKDEFLAMLAHELRNPLAPIRNSVQLLKLLGPGDPRLQKAREVIDRQVEHLTRLVDDLLDVSRITRGKINLQKEPVELGSVVARALETSRPLIDSRQHELALSQPGESLWVEADALRLAQVLSNLLNNAAKFTDEGGRISLTVTAENGWVCVRVRDNGMGIPKEMLPQVFEPFTQGDRSLDRTQGGLGIGLTLVRSLVEMHQGTVSVHSDGPGKGSEFLVRLPRLPEEATRTQTGTGAPGDAPLRTPRPCRILIVDDNRDAAESFATLLRMQGYEARTVFDGPGALQAAQEYRPEVVLLDIGLPGLDGYQVARRLRQEPALKNLLLVALTGYGQEADRQQAWQAGFDYHFVKPVEPAVVMELLARRVEAGRRTGDSSDSRSNR